MDDFDFGASIWTTPEPALPSPPFQAFGAPPLQKNLSQADTVDDFESCNQSPVLDDDDFGDFEDFGDGFQASEDTPVHFDEFENGDLGFGIPPEALKDWAALQLEASSSGQDISEQVEEILEPLWVGGSYTPLNDEDIRQVEGINQTLVSPESRTLYSTLFQSTPPNSRPPNWIRSRIRRQHLVSLGIPVNLDEILPQVNGGRVQALNSTTRPSSAPPGPRAKEVGAQTPHTRPSTPKAAPSSGNSGKGPATAQLSLGPKPTIDEAQINKLLALSPENLRFLPLATLEKHLHSIRLLTADSSGLLSHLLQTRDALQQDSEMYNGLIAGLVGEAQKMKSGGIKSRTGMGKRGSGMG